MLVTTPASVRDSHFYMKWGQGCRPATAIGCIGAGTHSRLTCVLNFILFFFVLGTASYLIRWLSDFSLFTKKWHEAMMTEASESVAFISYSVWTSSFSFSYLTSGYKYHLLSRADLMWLDPVVFNLILFFFKFKVFF